MVYATVGVVGKYPTKKEEMNKAQETALESAVFANDFTGAAVIAMEMATESIKNADYEMASELLDLVNLCLQHAGVQLNKMADSLKISLPN